MVQTNIYELKYVSRIEQEHITTSNWKIKLAGYLWSLNKKYEMKYMNNKTKIIKFRIISAATKIQFRNCRFLGQTAPALET